MNINSDLLADALTSHLAALFQSRIDAARAAGWVGENLDYVYTDEDMDWIRGQMAPPKRAT